MLINKIVSISCNQEKAKEIQERVQKKREAEETVRLSQELDVLIAEEMRYTYANK